MLSWPVSGEPDETDEPPDPRTFARLRRELESTKRDLRRAEARIDHLEQENERLMGKLRAMPIVRPPMKRGGLVLASEPPDPD